MKQILKYAGFKTMEEREVYIQQLGLKMVSRGYNPNKDLNGERVGYYFEMNLNLD